MKATDRIPGLFIPFIGKVYQNEGGGEYECISSGGMGEWHQFRNVRSGWVLVAHHVHLYPDGSIDWDYSTDGHFERRMK